MCISSLTAFPPSFLVLISVVINTFTSLQFAACLPSSCLSLLNKVRINIYKMLKYFWSVCVHMKRFWNSAQQSAVWTLISEMFALFACRNVTKLITCMAIQMLKYFKTSVRSERRLGVSKCRNLPNFTFWQGLHSSSIDITFLPI